MMGLMLFEGGDGVVEGEPLGDPDVKLVVPLHGFEREEVIPVGEVLHGGDAVGQSVVEREGEGLAADGRGRFGNVWLDESEGRSFADDAGEFALGVEVDLAACGCGGFGGDAGGGEGGGVGDGDVAVSAVEQRGMAGGYGVEVLSCG